MQPRKSSYSFDTSYRPAEKRSGSAHRGSGSPSRGSSASGSSSGYRGGRPQDGGYVTNNEKIEAVKLKNKKEIKAKQFILATGGKSRPETGSTGEGFTWLAELGHKIVDAGSALVPLAIKEDWVKKISGVSLTNIKISVFQNNVKQDSRIGKILFTHVGVSGPTILNMSKDIGELLKYDSVILELDLLPSLDYGKLNLKLQEVFKENDKKKFKNSLSNLLPSAIAMIIVELSKINPDTACNSITREERLTLVKLIKHVSMTVTALLGLEKAIIASGGVELTEVDFKTMTSRLYSNLYIIGDLLNIDRPSGGYSLQLCWTTGFVAGTHATHKLKEV